MGAPVQLGILGLGVGEMKGGDICVIDIREFLISNVANPTHTLISTPRALPHKPHHEPAIAASSSSPEHGTHQQCPPPNINRSRGILPIPKLAINTHADVQQLI